MTVRVLAVGNSNTDQVDHRSLITSLTQAEGSTTHRPGLFASSSVAVLSNVSAMVVGVGAFKAIVANQGGSGGYLVQNDATVQLTFDAGEAAVTRTDRIIVRVYNNAQDSLGIDDAQVLYLKGQTSGAATALPNGALLLWEIPVPAGASAGSGGINFTGIAVDKRVYTTSAGGIIPVASYSELSALTSPFEGQTAYTKDTDAVWVHDGTNWKVRGQATVSTSSSLSSVYPNPYDGMLVTARDTQDIWQYNGSAWFNTNRPLGAIVNRSTNFSITSGGAGVLISWENELYDNGNVWTSGSPTRFTIPSGGGGIWLVNCYLQYATNSSGVRDAHLLQNGTNLWEMRVTASTVGHSVGLSGTFLAAAGDYLEVRGLQNSGSSLNILPARASAFRIGSSA